MLSKVINVNDFKIIDSTDEAYYLASGKLWAGSEFIGIAKILPGMDKKEKLIVQYAPSLKKNRIISLYSDQYRWSKIKIIPQEMISTDNTSKYSIIKNEQNSDLYDNDAHAFFGRILSDETIAEQVIVETAGRTAGKVIGIITGVSWQEQQQEKEERITMIENKIGQQKIPDLRQLLQTKIVNGEEVLFALGRLLADRHFDQDYLGLIEFKEGDFLKQVSAYLDVLITIDKEMAVGPNRRVVKNDYFQNAITIAIYMNIAHKQKNFKNNEEYAEYEEKVISKVLKLRLKAFIKMTQKGNLPETKVVNALLQKTDDIQEINIKRGSDKYQRYYRKHNISVDVPDEYQQKAKNVINYLVAQKKVASSSVEKLTGVIKFVFNERGYHAPQEDYYKIVLALGEEVIGKKVKTGVSLTHSSLLSFFRVLANAFDVEHFEDASFQEALKQALLLTLIDANYSQTALMAGGFLNKYVPAGMAVPSINKLSEARLTYHREVLRLIKADKSVADPFDLFFEKTGP